MNRFLWLGSLVLGVSFCHVAHGAPSVVLTLDGHTKQASAVDFSANGKWLVSCGEDDTVRIWDAATGKLAHSHEVPYAQTVQFLPNNKTVAVTSFASFVNDGKELRKAFVLDVASGTTRAIPGGHQQWRALPLANGRLLVTESAGIRLLSLPRAESLKLWEIPEWKSSAVAISPDGRRIANGYGVLWDLEKGREIARASDLFASPTCQHTVAFAPNGKHYAVVEVQPGQLHISEADTGKEVCVNNLGPLTVLSTVGYTPDGKRLVVGGFNYLALHDAATGELVSKLKDGAFHATCLAFAPDGKRMAVSEESGKIFIWDISDFAVSTPTTSKPAK